MDAKEAAALGAKDGAEEVDDVLREQGRDVVIATTQPGFVGWDEAAINAGAHRFRHVPECFRHAYYRAYEKAARVRAEEIAGQ